MNRKNPINRNQMFFSKSDFDFEIEMARDYLEQDMNQTVVLFEVDLSGDKLVLGEPYHP